MSSSTFPIFGILTDGISRPNRYKIQIPTAVLLNLPYFKQIGITKAPNLEMHCEVAELPGMNLATSDIRHYGPIVKHPFAMEYPKVNLTFRLSSNMMEKYFFEAWLYSIQDPITNNLYYYKQYTQDVTVFKLDESNNTTYSCTLIDAFPIGIEEVSLSFSEKDSYSQLNIRLAYKKWINDKIDLSGPPISTINDITPFNQTIQPTS